MTATATSRDGQYDRLAFGILLVVAVAAALSFRDYGLSWDDFTHSEYGEMLLAFYTSGFKDQRALSFVNLYRYGGGYDLLSVLAAKISPFGLFETRRLIGAVVGIAGMAATWRAARHAGGALAGLIAVALIASCPLYVGHMFMNPKDGPFAAAMAFLLLGLVRVFTEYPRPSVRSQIVFGLGVGLAVGTRILAGLDALAVLAVIPFILVAETRAQGLSPTLWRLLRFLLVLLPPLVLAYAVMALVWPWGAIDPLNPIRTLIYFSAFFEEPWKELYRGELISVPDMPASYAPTLFALKLPEILVGLGAIGIVGAVIAAARRTVPINRRAVLLLVALAAVLPVAITMITRPAMYNGIRHFVFVIPPLAALGGVAGAWIADWLQPRSRAALAAAALLFIAGVASPVVEMVRLHPYEYTHFNRIAGGVASARERYMLDYWGLSLKQASDALLKSIADRRDSPPAGQRWRVAVCGPHPPAKVALGPDFETTWDPKGAQFAIMLGEYYCAKLPARLIAEITRAGATYARIYDIRGVEIPTLLTVPGLSGQ